MSNEPQNGADDVTPVDAELVDGEVTEDDEDLEIEVEGEDTRQTDPLADLEARAAELEAQHKDTYERLLRATADLDNLRKRTRREIDDARVEGRARTLREMLPVVDNLERALAHARQSGEGDTKSIVEGIELVLRQFSQALERCDVKRVVAAEQPFDPNLHEAVSQRESAEHPPGTVVEVLQSGYTIADKLLRPAMVVVSTAAAKPATEPEPSEPDPSDQDGAGEPE